MAADKDWKEKYYDSLQNLDDHQARWNELEELLRRAATRLAITAKGINKRLDRILADIQQHIRKKNDHALSNALDELSQVLADIDSAHAADTKIEVPEPVTAAPSSASSASLTPATLQQLVGELSLDATDQPSFTDFCQSMHGLDSDQCINGLAKLINELMHKPAPAPAEPMTAPAVAQVMPVSAVPDSEQADRTVISAADVDDAVQDAESVKEVLITLVEKIAFTHGESDQLNQIKKALDSRFDRDNWHSYLDQIISEVRVIIDGVNDEKGELESLIVDVTRQLTEISSVLNEEREAHLHGHEQAKQLQTLMDKSVNQIHESVDTLTDIHQLKQTIHDNLGAIKSGIQDFVHSDAERFNQSEQRNQRLVQQITALEEESQQLKLKLTEDRRKLMFDALTGARSRLSYEEVLEQEMYRWRRNHEVFSFAILDIDHFKRINDEYGHNAGDKALKIVAQLMGKNIRKTDFLFRIGGEEFVLLLPKTDLPGSEPLVEKLRRSIGDMDFHFKQRRVDLTLSAGLTTVTQDDTLESIYERADKALYAAKHGGRDRLVTIQ